jgi:hypothetical protein
VVEFVGEKFPFDDPSGHPGKTFVVVSRMSAKAPEGLIHVAIRRLADHALRLFNNDATIESIAQLIVERTRIQRRLVLKNCNGGHVGKSLGGGDVIIAHRTLMCPKEIERTNRSSA